MFEGILTQLDHLICWTFATAVYHEKINLNNIFQFSSRSKLLSVSNCAVATWDKLMVLLCWPLVQLLTWQTCIHVHNKWPSNLTKAASNVISPHCGALGPPPNTVCQDSSQSWIVLWSALPLLLPHIPRVPWAPEVFTTNRTSICTAKLHDKTHRCREHQSQ